MKKYIFEWDRHKFYDVASLNERLWIHEKLDTEEF